MPSFELKLDNKGIAELLKSAEMHAMVDEATSRIVGDVRDSVPDGVNVETDSYTTDRAGGAVVIADIRGMIYQAENGVLTKAASQLGPGVDVRPPKKAA
jgi:hypothetical protein